MKGGSGDGFFGYSCIDSKFQNHSTFPSGRNVITWKEEEERKKLTNENNGHVSFRHNARANI